MASKRKPYPSDVDDEEWSLVSSYLTLMTESARNDSTLCGNSSMAFAM